MRDGERKSPKDRRNKRERDGRWERGRNEEKPERVRQRHRDSPEPGWGRRERWIPRLRGSLLGRSLPGRIPGVGVGALTHPLSAAP